MNSATWEEYYKRESKQALSINLFLSRPILPSHEILDCEILFCQMLPLHYAYGSCSRTISHSLDKVRLYFVFKLVEGNWGNTSGVLFEFKIYTCFSLV